MYEIETRTCEPKNFFAGDFQTLTESGTAGGELAEHMLLSSELDAPAPCRLNAPDLDFACRASADCLHQHQQVI